ncbi:MAG: response regulator [Bacteroidales bacterium]|nr:response regulator [Bacteroidales bacterium]
MKENKDIHILIVEDSRTQAIRLQMILENGGFVVSHALDGVIAWNMIQNNLPDLVITDIMMPNMGGLELCENIKTNPKTAHLKTIILTSLTEFDDIINGLESGADNYLIKPPEEGLIFDQIDRILNDDSSHSNNMNNNWKVNFRGTDLNLSASPEKLLEFMASTYETALWQKKALAQTRDELKSFNDRLEFIVEERTKELIKQKQRAEESDRLKTAFLQNISHEIRTPLNAVVGFSNFLKEPDLEHAEIVEYSDLVHKSAYNLLDLINDVVDLSMIETGDMNTVLSVCNISDVINNFVSDFCENSLEIDSGIDFKINLPSNAELIKVEIDKSAFKKVLNNLIRNAFKFTENGSVELGLFIETDDRITVYVKDTGIGIPEDKVNEVFTPFQKVDQNLKKYRGTGVGLTISKRLVDSMNGNIYIKSELGLGTTVFVSFPCSINPINPYVESVEWSQEEIKDFFSGSSILVVEDDLTNHSLVEVILGRYGVKITKAYNGAEAVEIFRANRNFQLILMDLQMPVMDGVEATQIIRSLDNEIPIIALSAFAHTPGLDNKDEVGFTKLISKPIRPKSLVNALVDVYCRV